MGHTVQYVPVRETAKKFRDELLRHTVCTEWHRIPLNLPDRHQFKLLPVNLKKLTNLQPMERGGALYSASPLWIFAL